MISYKVSLFLNSPPGTRMLEINVYGGKKFKFSHRANPTKVKYHKEKKLNPIFFLPENVRVQVVSQQEVLIRNEGLP